MISDRRQYPSANSVKGVWGKMEESITNLMEDKTIYLQNLNLNCLDRFAKGVACVKKIIFQAFTDSPERGEE